MASTTLFAGLLPSAPWPARPSTACSTCSAAATRPTSSRSSDPASPGIASATSSPPVTVLLALPFSTPEPFLIAVSMESSSLTPKANRYGLGNWTRRWSSNPTLTRHSSSVPRPGASRTSRTTAFSSLPLPANPARCPSGKAMDLAVRSNLAAASAHWSVNCAHFLNRRPHPPCGGARP